MIFIYLFIYVFIYLLFPIEKWGDFPDINQQKGNISYFLLNIGDVLIPMFNVFRFSRGV